MDWKTFIATMTGHLAWPLMALVLGIVLVWLLRGHLAEIVGRLRELSLPGGFKMTLKEDLQKIQTQKEKLDLSQTTEVSNSLINQNIIDLAQKFPEAAILDSYKSIEFELLQIREALNLGGVNLMVVVQNLTKRGLIDSETLDYYNFLRKARNTAAHSGDSRATPGEAVEYAQQAAVMTKILRDVRESLPLIASQSSN